MSAKTRDVTPYCCLSHFLIHQHNSSRFIQNKLIKLWTCVELSRFYIGEIYIENHLRKLNLGCQSLHFENCSSSLFIICYRTTSDVIIVFLACVNTNTFLYMEKMENNVVHVSGDIPADDSDCEDSFEILSTQSLDTSPLAHSSEELPSLRLNSVHEMQSFLKEEISQVDAQFSITSSQSSFLDVQKQVQELILENEKLKNTVKDNNLTMSTQYDKIMKWRGDVTKVLKEYRDKLSGAKVIVDEYKDKNSELESQLELHITLKQLMDEEIIKLRQSLANKRSVDHIVDKNLVELDTDILRSKIKDLETALAESNMDKSDLAITKTNQEQQLDLLHTQISKLQIDNNQIEKLEATLNETFKKNQALTHELEILTKLTLQIPKLEEKLEEQKKLVDLRNIEIAANINRTNELFVKETKNMEQIRELQDLLEHSNYQLMKFSEHNQHLMEEVKQQEDFQNLRQQLIETQIQVTSLEQELNRKYDEIKELRHLLTQTSLKDEVFALESQLEVYRKDFEAEKASKVELKRERDQLAEDLRNVQVRNKQMQTEVERLRALNTAPGTSDLYLCPKCSFGFNSYQSLENHVHRCLDLEGFP